MANYYHSPNNFSDVANILKNRIAAIRTKEDLRSICNVLDPALNASDVVWQALSERQKLVLCKYFELKTVFEDEGQLLCVEKRKGVDTENDSFYTGGVYILVHGRATISISCGGPSLLVHGGTSQDGQLGIVLGRLSIPSDDAREFFKLADAKSLYNRFVSPENRRGNEVTIRFEKGSTYVFLPEAQSRCFLCRLNASLIAKRVLNDIGIAKILCKQKHEKGCTHESLVNGENKVTKVVQFRAGQILIKEGDAPDRVFFIAKGSCFILRSNKDTEVHCVGSILSPCFIGISALFDVNHLHGGMQPVSVVAATDGFAFSFCSLCFLTCVDQVSPKSELRNAFQVLTKSQMSAWVNDDREEDSLAMQHEIKPQTNHRKLKEVHMEEPAKENSVNMNPNENTDMPVEVHADLHKGKLNRSKFLFAIHDTLSKDPCMDVTKDDLVCDREKWLLGGDKSHLLADVMISLTEGCGVDFTRCEGKDPFHDFTIDTPTDANGSLEMLLQMPFRMPNRLRHMANNSCLGRKRPLEYEDPDPFLEPCPSVVSRKMHGKTLPMVRQTKCEDPPISQSNEF